jgi:hypothetical protein
MVIALIFPALGFLAVILVAISTGKISAKECGSAMLAVGLIISVPIILSVIVFWPRIQEGRFMKNGEKYAKRAVTGNELQAWAMKALADPENEKLKTNYPPRLRNLYPGSPPQVWVINTNSTVSTPWVYLVWGGVDWMSGFEIGPSNYLGTGHKWQEGVYFDYAH